MPKTPTSNTARPFEQLAQTQFDVVIIGGGISGAWLSLHCAQAGLKTLLLEQQDFASQTSSSSSKLLHGGIRYLQTMQFGKVRESAFERAEYMYAAPHLSVPVPFIVPTYRDFPRSKLFLNCGMLAYQTLCIGEGSVIDDKAERFPSPRSVSHAQLNELIDLGNEPHTGGVVFYERHMPDSERMVLSILRTAETQGATVVNYASAEGFTGDASSVTGVRARDMLTGANVEIKSQLVVNAAGPWIDELNSTLQGAESAPKISGFAVGSHIITRQLSSHAIALTTKHRSDAKIDRGGRHVFVIPWRGYSLIGTSYEETNTAQRDLQITSSQVTQLLDAVNQNIPNARLSAKDIISAYSGLYPLNTEEIKSSVYQGTGEYRIIDHQTSNGVSGLVTSLGAKFTTGRKLSELTMRVIGQKLGAQLKVRRCKLLGANYQNQQSVFASNRKKYAEQLNTQTVDHLTAIYGDELDTVVSHVEEFPNWQRTICQQQPDIIGQVVWAVQQEHAQTLEDVLYRRTSLAHLGIDQEGVSCVADVMATLLQWTDETKQAQLEAYHQRVTQTRKAIDEAQQGE